MNDDSVVCNCTHLTDFIAENTEEVSGENSQFVSVASTAGDLSLEDISNNLGAFLLLLSIWIYGVFVFILSFPAHRHSYVNSELREYYDVNFQDLLVFLNKSPPPGSCKSSQYEANFMTDAEKTESKRMSLDVTDRSRKRKHSLDAVDTDTNSASALPDDTDKTPDTSVFSIIRKSIVLDNAIIILLTPASWYSVYARRRAMIVIMVVITLLFNACRTQPAYMCGQTDDDGEVDTEVSADDMFMDDMLGFLQELDYEGAVSRGFSGNIMLLVRFFLRNVSALFVNQIFLWPVILITVTEAKYAAMYEETTELFRVAIMETEPEALFNEDESRTVAHARTKLLLLRELRRSLQRKISVLSTRIWGMHSHMRKATAEAKMMQATSVGFVPPISDTELSETLLYLRSSMKLLGLEITKMETRQKELRAERKARRYASAMSAISSCKNACHEKNGDDESELEKAACLAAMPQATQVSFRYHKFTMEQFRGNVIVRNLKNYVYRNYFITEAEILHNQISPKRLGQRLVWIRVFGAIYLLACTFWIFLYAVSKGDDPEAVNTILATVLFSYLIDSLLSSPTKALAIGIIISLVIQFAMPDFEKIETLYRKSLRGPIPDDEVSVGSDEKNSMIYEDEFCFPSEPDDGETKFVDVFCINRDDSES